ncbi:hypothetical protein FM115_02505 [Marinilactibacillus psychrotolerans 42ea]|uniref:Uncharacterized protein n=1 Tax=Marinilactibacillus psychrotolerans 42ea TaxID=1255609 RepID=A0A1R4IT75_9LACT|nr:hypothetical protein FM115_02505 [Marinilactibacillus psychrotolerans 42ea]
MAVVSLVAVLNFFATLFQFYVLAYNLIQFSAYLKQYFFIAGIKVLQHSIELLS